jgi:hypothetical protein
MASATIRTGGAGRVTAPIHTDGTPYRYEMVHGAGTRRTYADDPVDLVAALIPGYAGSRDPVEAARARIVHAAQLQVTVQAAVNVELGTADCSPEEREILSADRAVPPAVAQWSAPVPLVLVDCFYAPVTDLPRPVPLAPGEIRWLRPATDWDHLRSLAELGVIVLAEHTDGHAAGHDTGLDTAPAQEHPPPHHPTPEHPTPEHPTPEHPAPQPIREGA